MPSTIVDRHSTERQIHHINKKQEIATWFMIVSRLQKSNIFKYYSICVRLRSNKKQNFVVTKASLKCALLSNGKKYASIPISYSVMLKESYDTMDLILKKLSTMSMTG